MIIAQNLSNCISSFCIVYIDSVVYNAPTKEKSRQIFDKMKYFVNQFQKILCTGSMNTCRW